MNNDNLNNNLTKKQHARVPNFKTLENTVWDFFKAKNFDKALSLLQTCPINERKDGWMRAYIHYLLETKQFQSSIDFFTKIRYPLLTDYVEYARAYKELKKYKEAIAILDGISNQKHRRVLLGKAYCYQALGENEIAIEHLKQMEGWEHDEIALICIRANSQDIAKRNKTTPIKEYSDIYYRAYPHKQIEDQIWDVLKVKQLNKAEQLINQIPESARSDGWWRVYANYLFERGQYKEIAAAYKKVEKKTQFDSLLIARSSFALGETKEAFDILNGLDPKGENDKVLDTKGQLYQRLEQWNNALLCFNKIKDKDLQVLISIAHCSEQLKSYRIAAEILEALPPHPFDPFVLLLQSNCYQELGESYKALALIQKVPADKKNDDIAYKEACCYTDLGLYDKAIACYKKIPHYEGAQLGIAYCYVQLGNYGYASELYQALPDTNVEAKILGLAKSENGMGNFTKSIQYYQSMADINNNINAVLSFALTYQDADQFKAAEEILHNYPGWESDKKIMLALAILYQKWGKYDKALANYITIEKLGLFKDCILHWAQCYQDMGLFSESIRIYEKIHGWASDREALIGRSRCYFESGEYDKALDEFYKYPRLSTDTTALNLLVEFYRRIGNYGQALSVCTHWHSLEKNDNRALIKMGHCYRDMGLYKEAHQLFCAVKEQMSKANYYDKRIDVNIARCLQFMGEFDQAIVIYKNIKNSLVDKKLRLNMIYCYEEMGNYDQAIQTVIESLDWKKDKTLCLQLSTLYQKKGQHQKAWDLAKQLEKDFPDSVDVAHHVCRLAFYQQKNNSQGCLIASIKKWPTNRSMKLFKAEQDSKKESGESIGRALTEFLKEFPNHQEGYLKLMQHYADHQCSNQIKMLMNNCYQRFAGNYKFFNDLEEILENIPALHQMIQQETNTVTIPKRLKILWMQLPSGDNVYLVGSTVHQLLNKKQLSMNHSVSLMGGAIRQVTEKNTGPYDLDFRVINPNKCRPNTWSYFTQSPYNSSLYHKNTAEFSIDWYKGGATLSEDVEKSDFTISCIYLSRNGKIADPTGLGLKDFRNMLLRTVGSAEKKFIDDPICILRAIKYTVRGFKPTEEVRTALKKWSGEIKNMDLFKKTLVKNLHTSPNPQGYLEQLNQYGLLEKAFKTSCRSVNDFFKWYEKNTAKVNPNSPQFFKKETPPVTAKPARQFGHKM